MTPQWVVQVCDSRISYGSSGAPPFDSARKILFYAGHGAQLSIAYSGFATVRETDRDARPVEVWLADTAPQLAAMAASVPEFAVSLMSALETATEFTKRNEPGLDGRLSIVMSGFVDSAAPPGAICLSNFQRGGFRLPLRPGANPTPVRVPADVQHKTGSFEYTVVTKPTGIGLLIHGDHTAITPAIASELQSALQQAAVANDPLAVRPALVAALAAVAASNPTGTISADCWSRVVWRDGRPELFQSHFSDAAKQSLNPTLIGPGFRVDSVLVSQQPTAAFESASQKLSAGLSGQRLDTPTLIAFLEWSPRIAAMAAQVEQLGVTITRPSYVADLLKLIDHSGYKYVVTLERHITSAGTWADEMAREVMRDSIEKTRGLYPLVGENVDPAKATVDREFLLELLLIGLDPDRFPTEPPPGAFLWRVTDELKAVARRFNPKITP